MVSLIHTSVHTYNGDQELPAMLSNRPRDGSDIIEIRTECCNVISGGTDQACSWGNEIVTAVTDEFSHATRLPAKKDMSPREIVTNSLVLRVIIYWNPF